MIAKKNKSQIDITSRNLNSYTRKFSSLIKPLSKIKYNVVIDGEVVALDKKGNPGFQLLQNYQSTGIGNIVYYIFDILWCEGHDLKEISLTKRKEILKMILPPSKELGFSDHIIEHGIKLFSAIKKKGMEGVIAKESGSLYREGARSAQWLKIKTEKTQEAVICGFTAPAGGRKYFGSLILGVYDNGTLKYIGHTGTGFNEARLQEVFKLLNKLVQNNSPFEKNPKTNAAVTWLKAKIVCEIKFSNWTVDGILRHPVFVGIRADKSIKEVKRET